MDIQSQNELMQLPASERLALIAKLWESLEAEELPVTAAQQVELDRRLETLEEDRAQGKAWAELKDEMERRCP